MTDEPDERETAVQADCDALVASLVLLRDFDVPAKDADQFVVADALHDLRVRLDEAEPLLLELTRLRSKARIKARKAAERADDTYDEVLEKLSKRAVTMAYEGVQDRLVQARVKALHLRRPAREAQLHADIADDALDRARRIFFGLRDIREELLTRMRTVVPLENALER